MSNQKFFLACTEKRRPEHYEEAELICRLRQKQVDVGTEDQKGANRGSARKFFPAYTKKRCSDHYRAWGRHASPAPNRHGGSNGYQGPNCSESRKFEDLDRPSHRRG